MLSPHARSPQKFARRLNIPRISLLRHLSCHLVCSERRGLNKGIDTILQHFSSRIQLYRKQPRLVHITKTDKLKQTLILFESVRNMVSRSIPRPQPAVGGRPYSRAVQKFSSTNIASSSPAALSYVKASIVSFSTKRTSEACEQSVLHYCCTVDFYNQ